MCKKKLSILYNQNVTIFWQLLHFQVPFKIHFSSIPYPNTLLTLNHQMGSLN